MMYFSCHSLDLASQESEDSLMRLAYIAIGQISGMQCVVGRLAKPFNPLLGETFEIVNSKFRFFIETVSHHPPIAAFDCQG